MKKNKRNVGRLERKKPSRLSQALPPVSARAAPAGSHCEGWRLRCQGDRPAGASGGRGGGPGEWVTSRGRRQAV